MVDTDLDSLTGHWATQGPNFYLLMRLQTRPEADVDALLDEYYSAFGPAAAAEVKTYFDHWERYTLSARTNIGNRLEDFAASRWRRW